MRILPVLDLLNGQVVRGIAGRRSEYRPIVSRLTASSEPLAVAQAFREHFGFSRLYLADLDALAGQTPNLEVVDRLQQADFPLWIDAGLRRADDADALIDRGVDTVVAGLESLEGLEVLERLIAKHSARRVVFSLDLREGQPLAGSGDAWSILQTALRMGVRRVLLLDLAGVGMEAGVRTADLCRRLRTEQPTLEITTGGGVRGPDDLRQLEEIGVDFALVASALHDGRFLPWQ